MAASWTFLNMCAEVRREAAVGSSGPTAVTSQTGMLERIVYWVRDAWLEIQNKYSDWNFRWVEFTDATEADTGAYDLGRLRVGSELYVNGVALPPPVDFTYLKSLLQDAETNVPQMYAEQPDGKILFYPTPDAVYTIAGEHYSDPQTLTSEDDVITLDDKYALAIKWLAMMYYAGYEESGPQYNRAEKHYRDVMSRLEAEQLPPADFGGPLA